MTFTLMNAAAIEKSLAHIARTSAVYVSRVQTAFVHAIGHAITHGDVTIASRMLSYVRNHDKHILVRAFEQNGPFKYDAKVKAFFKNTAWTTPFDPTTIPHWESCKAPVKVSSVFDVEEAFQRFFKTAIGQMGKAQQIKNEELLTYLKDASARYAVDTFKEMQAMKDARSEQQPETVAQ